MDGVAQRQRHRTAFRRFDAVSPRAAYECVVGEGTPRSCGAGEPEAPLRLDGPRRRVFDHVDDGLPFPRRGVGNLLEGGLGRHGGAGVAVAVEGHVGHSAVGGNRRRLPGGKLERWHIGGGRDVVPERRAHRGLSMVAVSVTAWPPARCATPSTARSACLGSESAGLCHRFLSRGAPDGRPSRRFGLLEHSDGALERRYTVARSRRLRSSSGLEKKRTQGKPRSSSTS